MALIVSRLCNPRGDEVDADSAPACSVPLLNSTLKPVPDEGTFPLFSSLPKELRLQIWEEATPRKRLVHLDVEPDRDNDKPVRYLEKNHLGNPMSGSGYHLRTRDGRLDHVLLYVCREARQVVLSFYRIKLPVFSAAGHGHSGRRRTLRINPEHDVLQIRASEPVKRTLVDLLWDLRAQDPRGVGVLKLALDLREFCASDLPWLRRSDLLLIRQRQVLTETLSQLQEVWFMSVDLRNGTYKRSAEAPGSIVPYGVEMSGYECVGPEARDGAGAELQRVYMGSVDPRELIWRWEKLLRTWHVRHPPGQVKYRLMVAQDQGSWKDARRGKGFGRFRGLLSSRDRDRDRDPAVYFKDGRCEAGGGTLADQVKNDEPNAATPAAVGFWSFPVEAAGEIGKGDDLYDMDFEPDRFLDLRSHWPELVLAKMSQS